VRVLFTPLRSALIAGTPSIAPTVTRARARIVTVTVVVTVPGRTLERRWTAETLR
jgi:hypothetical protein